jgi:hypothetical protein
VLSTAAVAVALLLFGYSERSSSSRDYDHHDAELLPAADNPSPASDELDVDDEGLGEAVAILVATPVFVTELELVPASPWHPAAPAPARSALELAPKTSPPTRS